MTDRLGRASLLATLVAVAACSTAPDPPPRPDGVPATATWAGGLDGGAFIECRDTDVAGLVHCTVYNDSSGAISDEGLFSNDTGVARPDLAAQYSGYDGTQILLRTTEGEDRSPVLVPADSSGRALTEAERDARQRRFLDGA